MTLLMNCILKILKQSYGMASRRHWWVLGGGVDNLHWRSIILRQENLYLRVGPGDCEAALVVEVVQSIEKMIAILVKRDGMTKEDAVEFLDFNTLGGWLGEMTPIALD